MAVLALFDLELNIQIVTPGVQNDTLGYKWTLKQYDTSTQAYVDKSGELDKGKIRRKKTQKNIAFDK